jgi:hypothetical protein
MIEQILGWGGNILFGVGGYQIANKKMSGFISQGLANILYVIQAIMLHNVSLMWLSIGLGLFNVYGIYMWKKEAKVKFNDAEKAYAEAVCDLYDENTVCETEEF